MAEEAKKELIVFTQSYKSKNLPSTRILNQKHLVYIATRPGVMRNPDCGFGLWGKLPGMTASKNINDLRTAYQAVGKASENHTLYRSIISVNKNTATEYGLYDRETWQKLINSKISVIQREMGVKPENFRYVASMHYKKRHPHVHILWWDNGPEPRQEFMGDERFKLAAERIRHTFANTLIFEKKLETAQAGRSEAGKAARLQLAAVLKEMNIAEALNLDRIHTKELNTLGKGLAELARTLPATGRLKYKFLKPEYKDRLDAWLKDVLEIPEFARLEKTYMSLSEEVSKLYGNDAALTEKFQQQAQKKLYTDLGNELLRYLKDVAAELRDKEPPADVQRLRLATWRTAGRILREDPTFEELLHMLPKWGTPSIELLKDEKIKTKVDALTQRLAEDIRIRSKTVGLLAQTGWPGSKADRSAAYRAMYQSARAAILDEIGHTIGEPLVGSRQESGDLMDSHELNETVRRLAAQILRENKSFQQLMDELPKASPLRQSPLRQEKYQEQLEQIMGELTGDLRMRTLIEGYAAAHGADADSYRNIRKEECENLYRAMHTLILETVRQEKGYEEQEQQGMVVMALLRLFRSGSQSKNQLHSQRDFQREKYRNLSETAKRDLKKKRQQEGSWSLDL